MLHKNSHTDKRSSTFARLARTFVSVTLISAFVLSVTFGIKYLSETGPIGNLAILNKYIPQDSRIGQVAGVLTKKIEQNTINITDPESSYAIEELESDNTSNDSNPADPISNTNVSNQDATSASMTDEEINISIFADSHGDTSNLSKAVSMSNSEDVAFIVHLGDHTNLGTTEDLQTAYTSLSSSGKTFYAIPGDRDLWKTSGPQNFLDIFGNNKYVFTTDGSKFVVFDNSMNFSKIPADDMTWFKEQVADADFVFLSQPLYHPSNKVMGVFEGDEIVNVKKQGDELLSYIRSSDVKAIFAAEHHMSSETRDPQDKDLMHYVVGAITSTINEKPQTILQSPRFSILTVKGDGTYSVTEKIL